MSNVSHQITYAVDQIKVVEPDDMAEIQIVPSEDHVTLLTCTPRNINSHRLLVRGIRTENVATEDMDSGWSETTIYAFLGTLVLLALIAETINLWKKRKKNANRQSTEKN